MSNSSTINPNIELHTFAEVTLAEQIPFGDAELRLNTEQRCPCVLLIDVSGSMGEIVGESGRDLGYDFKEDGQTYRAVSGGVSRIDKVNEGLRLYQADVTSDALAAKRVDVSVITFGNTVETVTPFVSAGEFAPPTLTANGATVMGAAILQAIDTVTTRKRKYRENAIPCLRPWIFMITDGVPTDDWQAAATKVQEGERNKSFAFFAVGVEGADFDTLGKISVRKPLTLKGYSFREMFLWLSASQRSVSQSRPGNEDQIQLASPSGWASL